MSDQTIDAGTEPANPIVRPADQPRHGTLSSLTRRQWLTLTARFGGLVLVLGGLAALTGVVVAVMLVAAVTIAAS